MCPYQPEEAAEGKIPDVRYQGYLPGLVGAADGTSAHVSPL